MIRLFENYTEKQIRSTLSKKGVNLSISIDEFMEKLDKTNTHQFGFEGFVENDASFISEADKERMSEYITKIKETGFDVSTLEDLYPHYEEFRKLTLSDYGYNEEISDRLDELRADVEVFEIELRKLIKKVKETL